MNVPAQSTAAGPLRRASGLVMNDREAAANASWLLDQLGPGWSPGVGATEGWSYSVARRRSVEVAIFNWPAHWRCPLVWAYFQGVPGGYGVGASPTEALRDLSAETQGAAAAASERLEEVAEAMQVPDSW